MIFTKVLKAKMFYQIELKLCIAHFKVYFSENFESLKKIASKFFHEISS